MGHRGSVGAQHEFHKANNLIMPFFDAVIRERCPQGTTAGPVKLSAFPDRGAWLGAKDDWGESPAELRPWVNLAVEFAKKTTCWFPDSYVAYVWQAFVIRKPRLKITSPPGLGGGQELIIHRAGEPVEVEIAVPDDLDLQTLAVHLGDRTAAENDNGATRFTLSNLD